MSETSTYHRLMGPLRASSTTTTNTTNNNNNNNNNNKPATPDRDVVMSSPRSGLLPPPTTNRPLFSSDEFIPFSLDGDDTRSSNNNKKRRERGEEDVKPAQTHNNPFQVHPVHPVWIDPSVDVTRLSLGTELNHFYRWISLTDEENNLREHAVQLITDIVKSLWPAARVEVFGSHYTKISLPSSDVDLMVYNVRVDDPLYQISNEINAKHVDDFVLIKFIPNAKIPVLKLTTKLGEVKLDMCIATRDEPPNSVKIAQYLSQMPVLRPLVVILKQFLQQYLLNDTYTGGAGSYLLTLMSISLLQFRENPYSPLFLGTGGTSISHFGKSQDLGAILLEFFELYGKIFNYHKHGISVRDHGSYFIKQDRGWLMPHAPHLLSIEDPSDPENDVGRGSFNMMQVRLAFFQAFVRLTHPETERTMPNYKISTLLTRVIDVDPIYLSRRQRAKMIGASLQKKKAPETPEKKPYSSTPSSPSIMVGDKNLADEDAPTLPTYSSPSPLPSPSSSMSTSSSVPSPSSIPTVSTPPLNSSSSIPFPAGGSPIDIDSPEVEVIEIDPPSPPLPALSSLLSPSPLPMPSLIPTPTMPASIPTINSIPSSSNFRPSTSPNSLHRSTSPGSLRSTSPSNNALRRSTSPGSLRSTSPSNSTLSTSPKKAYSNGISNVIVNNHSRSPNGPSHYFTPNYTSSNFGFNYNNLEKTKAKKGKVKTTPAPTTTTALNQPTATSTTSTSTSTSTSTTTTTQSTNTNANPTPNTNNNSNNSTNKNTHKNNNNKNNNKKNKKKFHRNKEQHHAVYRPKNPTATNNTTTANTTTPTNPPPTNTAGPSTTTTTTNTTTSNNNNNKINLNVFSPGKRRKFEAAE